MHPSVLALASLLPRHGVTRVVLCPGSRNSPLTTQLSSMQEMECRSAIDERSAGFSALGWIAQSGKPVAVCVTSGSALLNLHPAVAEAAYRHLPLLIISADRPIAWLGQQDGQTVPQIGAFNSLCRLSTSIPEELSESWHRNRLINEALLELTHHGCGPVHLNLPLKEPLFDADKSNTPISKQPQERLITREYIDSISAGASHRLQEIIESLPKRLILLGQLPEDAHLHKDLRKKGFAIAGEHLCNTRNICTYPDQIIGPTPEKREDLVPDILISIGGCIISKRLKRLLRAHPPKEHWHISPDGGIIDTFCSLTRALEGDPKQLWELLVKCPTSGDLAYTNKWYTPPSIPQFPYSGMQLVGDLLLHLPQNSVLHLANSSAVRFAQLFPLPANIQVECNRGTNGIEGSLSSAVGYAAGDQRLQFIVCGDLSFFYDMNALWLPDCGQNLRILMLNNSGGGIFHTIPIPQNKYIQGIHNTQARGWVESRGFAYYRVEHPRDWPSALAALTSHSIAAPVFVEAFTDSASDALLLSEYFNKN